MSKIDVIVATDNGTCDECGKECKGARFLFRGARDESFLCWEHFRLLQEAMKPARVERVVEVTEIRSSGCCCHPCCCYCRHWSYTRNYGVGRSRSYSRSETSDETRSRGESVGMGESQSAGRSVTEGWSHGSGHSEGETR